MLGNADGSMNYPCAIYGYLNPDPALTSGSQAWWDRNRLRFVQFNGSTWDQLDLNARFLDEWWDQQDSAGTHPYFTFFDRPYNPAMCMAGGKIYAMVTRGGPSASVWNMYYLNSDLSGWTEAQKHHPMIVQGDLVDTQPHMFTGPDDKPYVVYPNGNYQFTIVKLENIGTGGWMTAGDVGIPLSGYQYSAVTPRVKCIGENVYLCGQIRTYGDYNYLSTFVWKGTRFKNFDRSWSLGLVSFNATVPLN